MVIRKYRKIILTIILLITVFSIHCSTTYASTFGEILSGGDGFVQDANSTPISNEKIEDLLDTLYNTLLIIGIAVAVIVGIILGIQFITGSVEQKSKIKESLIPYFVGCAVIFGALGIWKLVITIFSSLD